MACGTRVDATWHARPREPARGLGGSEIARMHGRATQVHADARVVPRGMGGGWQVKGPRVSGP